MLPGGGLMAEGDEAYYYNRARIELERARRTGDPQAAAVHHQLVEIYLARTSLLTVDGVARRPLS